MKLRLIEKEILNESPLFVWTCDDGELEKAAAYIKEHCAPYLSQSNVLNDIGVALWRGYRSLIAQESCAFLHTISSDRQPVAMSRKNVDILNAAIAERGLVANRTNSIFVTGHHLQAATFASVKATYLVFPRGDFSFTWSPTVKDANYFLKPFGDVSLETGTHDGDVALAQAVFDFQGDGSIDDAARSGNEIMISAGHYVGVRGSKAFLKEHLFPLLR